MTIPEFITINHILCESKKVAQNPYNKEWKNADHYEVTLFFGIEEKQRVLGKIVTTIEFLSSKKLVTYFSKGIGHKGKKPEVAEVLDCLASDSSSVENEVMDDWIDSMGYSSEGIKAIRQAEQTYRTCVKQAEELKKFLGETLYRQLLDEVEQL